MSSNTHAAAILALLEGCGIPADDGSTGESPATYPRVIVSCPPLLKRSEDLSGVGQDIDQTFPLEVVGDGLDSARAAFDTVYPLLHEVRPVVSGYVTSLKVLSINLVDVIEEITIEETEGHPTAITATLHYRATPAT